MGNRAGDGERSGGVTGVDAGAGALVWVIRRNGCWWPGRILGAHELPEDCIIPPRSTVPVKLLGRPDGSIDWYNLEMPNRVKPFRCGDFAECIENAKVHGCLQNKAYSNGNCALVDEAIMHALQIETSGLPDEETTNQTTECSKEDIPSTQDHRKPKMKITTFVTPISKEHNKRENSSLLQQDEGAMKCQALDSDAVGLDARVECDVFNSTELENNMKVYDVEMDAYGNYKGHGLPLVCLTSKSIGKPIKGYPVIVEILEDSCPPSNTEVHCQEIGHFDCLMESRISVPRKARSLRKPSNSRRISEHDLDKSWGPSTRSLSSSCNLPRKSLTEGSNRKPVIVEDSPLPIRLTSKPASSPTKMSSFSSFPDSQRESANMEPLVVKGSPRTSHSPPVDAMEDSENNSHELYTDNNADEYLSDNSTDEYHSGNSADEYHSDSSTDDYVRPTTQFAGSWASPPFSSPVATSSRSINGSIALYLCSASTLCPPVRLI